MNEQQDCVSGPNGYQNCVPFFGYAVVLGQIKVWTKQSLDLLVSKPFKMQALNFAALGPYSV